jgi:hypothetical protein
LTFFLKKVSLPARRDLASTESETASVHERVYGVTDDHWYRDGRVQRLGWRHVLLVCSPSSGFEAVCEMNPTTGGAN